MQQIEVTGVVVRKTSKTSMVRAVCSIILNDGFAIHDVKVIENSQGKLIVAMPSRKVEDGEGNFKWKDVAHPTCPEVRQAIERAVMKALKEYKENM